LLYTIEPFDDAGVALHCRDAVGHPLTGTVLLLIRQVFVTVPRLITVRADHAGTAEVERDDIRVGPSEALHTYTLQLLRVQPTVVEEALHVRPGPSTQGAELRLTGARA